MKRRRAANRRAANKRRAAILINTFLMRNPGISPWMKTPCALRRPLPGIETATYRSLWNSEQCERFYPFGHRGGSYCAVILV